MSPPPAMADPSGKHVTEVFRAEASFGDVYDWYAKHLPSNTQAVASADKRQATFALFDDRQRNVHLEGQSGSVIVYLNGTLAAGSNTVDPAISKTIALPVFPGAEPAEGGGVTKKLGASVVTAAYYHTSSPLKDVESFYAAHLPKGSLKGLVQSPNGGVADFYLSAGGAHKQVTLSSDNAGTTIALISTR